jgi:hypothetical protein
MKLALVLCGALLSLPISTANASAPVIPYEQAPSVIAWDSYPLASTEHETRVRASARGIFATPTIDGIYDDNIGLMTVKGRRAIERKGFKHLRLLVQYGTKMNDPQLVTGMNEANRYGWSVLLAVRVVQPAPKSSRYTKWLKTILRKYPRIDAIEPANEPEWNSLTVNQAVRYYRAATKVAENRSVLAGSFSDAPTSDWPFAEYAARVHATLYALHAYTNVWRNRLVRLRQTIEDLGAEEVWITEASAMVAYDNETFTSDEQIAQTQRIIQISQWSIVKHVFWTGWQSCIGCQPSATTPKIKHRMP